MGRICVDKIVLMRVSINWLKFSPEKLQMKFETWKSFAENLKNQHFFHKVWEGGKKKLFFKIGKPKKQRSRSPKCPKMQFWGLAELLANGVPKCGQMNNLGFYLLLFWINEFENWWIWHFEKISLSLFEMNSPVLPHFTWHDDKKYLIHNYNKWKLTSGSGEIS